jgi:DNA-binding MarR family transcriptional regulator
MVFLVDDLEARGLVERRRGETDRRSNALYLTAAGRAGLQRARTVARRNEQEISAALDPAARRELIRLLRAIAAEQGLSEEGLPIPIRGRPPRAAD